MTAMITLRGVGKRFGKTEVLRDLDLTVERGTVFALLGPNGAGKTTIVRVLSTLLKPDSGSAEVARLADNADFASSSIDNFSVMPAHAARIVSRTRIHMAATPT